MVTPEEMIVRQQNKYVDSYDFEQLAWRSTLIVGSELVDSDNPLSVVTESNGHVCTDNSFEETLAIDEVKTGVWQDTLNYNNIIIGVKSTQDSAIDGLDIQWSHDGLHVDDNDYFTISANKGKVFTFTPARRYVRVVYTNDGIEADVDVQTIFKKGGIKASSHRIQDSIVADDDAELVKAVLTGIDTNGVFQNVNTTVDGNLSISDNSSGLAIAKGDVTGHSTVQKFGNASDFDSGDGIITVWDGAEDGTAWELMRYVYSTTADIDSISSTSVGDTHEIAIQGLDSDYNLVNQLVTLQGQTRVALNTPLIRVFRAYNNNSVDLTGHVIVYVNGTISGGVPTNKSNIRAVIDPLNQQTEMAIYTVPAGKTAYLTRGYASTSGANKASNYVVRFFAREFGKVFRLQNVNAITENGNSIVVLDYFTPLKIPEKTDLEVRVEATGVGVTGASISAGFDLVLVDN